MEHTIACVHLDIRKILDSIMRVLKKVRKFKECIKLRGGLLSHAYSQSIGEGGSCTLARCVESSSRGREHDLYLKTYCTVKSHFRHCHTEYNILKYMHKYTVTVMLHPEVGSTPYFKFTIVHIQSFSMIY